MPSAWRNALLIIVALAVPIVPFAISGELPGDRWLSATDEHAARFALTGSALLASDVLLPIPSSVIGTLLGARLSLVPGFVAAWFGLTLGNVVGYLVGRVALSRLGAGLPALPTQIALFVSRPVPVLAEALCLAAGAGRSPFRSFLATCGAGNAIYAFVLAGNGAALLPASLLGPGLIVPMLLPVVAWLIWRWLARRRATAADSDS